MGCGLGQFEALLVKTGVCREVLGIDLSPTRIEAAQKNAGACAPQLEFRVGSASDCVPEAGFDLIVARNFLHHIVDLEDVVERFSQFLSDDGLLYFDEYVGPNRWQWTEVQLEIAERMLAAIPRSLRRDVTGFREYKDKVGRPPIEAMIAMDPSESVRSAEVEECVMRRFKWVERRPFGGTLLAPVFSRIMGNFADRAELVEMAIILEDLALEHDLVSSDYVWGVLRKRG